MDITTFCAEEDGRSPLSKPWVKEGWRYATDGRIAVREPTMAQDTVNRTETIEPLFGVPFLNQVARNEGAVVPTHDGKGMAGTQPACAAVENPTKETCKRVGDCDHDDERACTNRVDWRIPATQRFADHKWQGIYIELINAQLPGARCTVGANGYMYFWLGDVEGVLAPMKG